MLLHESIDLLKIKPDGVYVDVTFGGGGHTKAILSQLDTGKVIAFDRDADAVGNLIDDDRLIFVPEDFKDIELALEARGFPHVDGILADLGVSSHQFDTPNRGFSFRFDGPLDMRMDRRHGRTAADILNEETEERLFEIFRNYGELNNAKKLVRLIANYRPSAAITTTRQLESVIEPCIDPKRKSKYLAQVFQALRIEVNGEMESLMKLLAASGDLIRPGGRLVVIAYHSLEDRLVKRYMRSGNLGGVVEKDFYGNPLTPWNIITRKAIQAPDNEVINNSRARSARLRAAEKKINN